MSEREQIVAWLRSMRDSIVPTNDWCEAQQIAFTVAADSVERGDHLPQPPSIEE